MSVGEAMSAKKTRDGVILEISVLSRTKRILEKTLQTSKENLVEEKNKKWVELSWEYVSRWN